MIDVQTSAGLAGVVAGRTALSTVGQEGCGLTYRGYAIEDLAEYATFEEVAWLLFCVASCPVKANSTTTASGSRRLRDLPDRRWQTCWSNFPPRPIPWTCCGPAARRWAAWSRKATRIRRWRSPTACWPRFPSMLAYWHPFHQRGRRIATAQRSRLLGRALPRLAARAAGRRSHLRALDVSLILYAEHEFNASTFAARVAASTLSDFYSAITAAIGTLRGPLHGGANEASFELIDRFCHARRSRVGRAGNAAPEGKSDGFRPPRLPQRGSPDAASIQRWAKRLSDEAGDHRLVRRSPSGSSR